MNPTPETDPSHLTEEQKGRVLAAAAGFVAGALLSRPVVTPDADLGGAAALPVAGAYVTLKRRGRLRACCGSLGEPRPLLPTLARAARHTATRDPRLPPVSAGELPFLDLDVNLLFGNTPVTARGRDRVGAVEVGRHGLRVRRGEQAGLLLPGVAVEHGWDAETFLRQVCRKAGLPTTAWEDDATELHTFESVEFGGPFDPGAIRSDDPAALAAPRDLTPDLLGRIAEFARGNVLALLRGRTPSFYEPGVPDGNVPGLALTLVVPGAAAPVHLVQLSLRPGVPFQATLFGLCEAAAKALGGEPRGLRVGVTVLTDPAAHGTAEAPDLRGLDPARRALVLIDRDRTSWAYRPGAAPDELLAGVLAGLDLPAPGRAGLYGLEAQSTEPEVVFRSSPRGVADVRGARPPAVAGRFYPADPGALSGLVGGLLAGSERRPEVWPAAMVPHAGLAYSGRVAAAVFHRLKIPGRVLVIGPKHTRAGVDWAVDPHGSWAIPGAELAADPELARALAAAIPGLQLDAGAHRGEHAVEVELLFLARLAPAARVVGLAVGPADWSGCQRFAAGLAGVIRGLPEPPLLLVSSDMNHFAGDGETRRLDETALGAMGRLDPGHLLQTVTDHEISMCGVVPAVIVMETLRLLGGLQTCERVAYATSADAGGDPGRCVGYAGVLLR